MKKKKQNGTLSVPSSKHKSERKRKRGKNSHRTNRWIICVRCAYLPSNKEEEEEKNVRLSLRCVKYSDVMTVLSY